jgi:hypothetical protein
MLNCSESVATSPLPSHHIRAPQITLLLFFIIIIQDLSGYTKAFDTNGVLFYLGTERGTKAYKNPQITGVVAVQMSTVYTVLIISLTIVNALIYILTTEMKYDEIFDEMG